MSDDQYHFEPSGRRHNRAAFSCGVDALDEYLRQRVGQDVRRSIAAVFVLQDVEVERIAGYYTLSASSVSPTDLPEEMVRQLPRYQSFPVVLLGRLAVDVQYQGQALGELLLYDAFRRALTQSSQIASMAVVVDAKDDAARRFYERYGFKRLMTDPYRLSIPMRSIARLVGEV